MKLLSPEEIKRRLHLYNLDHDWSHFDDVPPEQYVHIMYPDVIIPYNPKLQESILQTATAIQALVLKSLRDQERKQFLNRLFGEL